MKHKIYLGIETSCDDTSIAIIKKDIEDSFATPEILAFNSFSQETMLRKWGGVVPEIAARNHLEKLVPLIDATFKDANLSVKDIDTIGVTTNPGLLGPLLTGLNAAKSIALFNKSEIVPVNHLFAHIEAIHLTEPTKYPFIGLLVSGGHSIYFLVRSETVFEMLGSTIDDAAGEAFDKGAKLMGLGYPGGKMIDDFAKLGDHTKFEFPIGLKSSKDSNLSYSGVKTSLRQFLEKNPEFYCDENEISNGKMPGQDTYDLCASYQHAIISALLLKMRYAVQKAKELTGKDLPIVVGGGVACNSYLRTKLKEKFPIVKFVSPKYCTDNGAMIANYASRTAESAIKFPDCLYIDARGRFISKGDKLQMMKDAKKAKKNQNNKKKKDS